MQLNNPLSLPFEGVQIPQHLDIKKERPLDKNAHQIQKLLLEQVFDHYNQTLLQSRRALNHLEKSLGISNFSFIDAHNVGFVDRTLGIRLPDSDSFDGGNARGILQRTGIFKSSGHELFRGAIVFPLFDIDGRLVGIFGYKIGERLIGERVCSVFWNKSSFGIFNSAALTESSKIVLCKTPLEAARLWSIGCHNVVSVYCVKSYPEALQEALFASKVTRVELFYESDFDEQWIADSEEVLKALNIPFQGTLLSDYKTPC